MTAEALLSFCLGKRELLGSLTSLFGGRVWSTKYRDDRSERSREFERTWVEGLLPGTQPLELVGLRIETFKEKKRE